MAWWNKPKEGAACTTADNTTGTIVNGVCQPTAQQNPPPRPIAQGNLQVSNPNGARMYYQQDLASGGKIYSPSNVIIPAGTKLNLVKVWQTNTSNMPFFGYYETTYKDYGALSGFFATSDIIKL